MSTSDPCPICKDPSACRGYPLMWQRLRAGRDVAHWTRIHSQLNGTAGAAEPPSYPPLLTQAGNAAAAAGRVVGAFLTGQPVAVDAAEQERRLALCRDCDRFDPAAGRCTVCGCYAAWKARLASQACPLDPPRW